MDACAIDSTVLETELAHTPHLRTRPRVVTTLGPSPIPPLVVSRSLPAAVRDDLRDAALKMHRDPHGAATLAAGRVHRYVAVQDSDYDAIRTMASASDTAPL